MNSLAAQVRHYADVRAKLRGPTRRQFVKREWSTPAVAEMQSASERLTAVVREIMAREFMMTREIIDAVAVAYDLPTATITVRCRRYAEPRQIAMALAHRRMNGRQHGLAKLERAFKRDHSTILHAVRKFGPMIEQIAGGAA